MYDSLSVRLFIYLLLRFLFLLDRHVLRIDFLVLDDVVCIGEYTCRVGMDDKGIASSAREAYARTYAVGLLPRNESAYCHHSGDEAVITSQAGLQTDGTRLFIEREGTGIMFGLRDDGSEEDALFERELRRTLVEVEVGSLLYSVYHGCPFGDVQIDLQQSAL